MHLFLHIKGREHGLFIGLSMLKKNKYFTSLSSGLIVYVHDINDLALDLQEVHLQRGKLSSLSVKLVKTYNYPQPYSDCIEIDTLSLVSFRFF